MTPMQVCDNSLSRAVSRSLSEIGLFISNFQGFSVEVGGVFCSKLTSVDCRFDREIDGELLKNALKFAPKMAPNGLRAIPEIGNKHARLRAL